MTDDDLDDDDDLDPAVLQAAADALAARHGHQHVAAFAEDYREMAAPVVRAVTPLIRQQIRDEIRDQQYISSPHFDSEDFDIGMTIAAEIASRSEENVRRIVQGRSDRNDR